MELPSFLLGCALGLASGAFAVQNAWLRAERVRNGDKGAPPVLERVRNAVAGPPRATVLPPRDAPPEAIAALANDLMGEAKEAGLPLSEKEAKAQASAMFRELNLP